MELTTYETNPAAAIELLQQEYSWLPSKELERRALQVFRTNAPKIRAALGGGSMFATFYNIDEATLNALLEDYARALLGVYIPVATPAQIETLKPLLTDDAYNIDRWGLGLAVIHNYWNISAGLQLYEEAHQTKEAAAAYLNELKNLRTDAPEPTCIILTTIYQTEHAGRYFFDYDYFNEAAGEKAVKTFISQCYVQADFYAYTIYSGIVEYVLGEKEAPRVPKRIKAVKNLAERAKARTRAINIILQGSEEDTAETEHQPNTSTPENPLNIKLRSQELEHLTGTAQLQNRINKVLSSPIEYLKNTEKKLKRGKEEVHNIALVQKPADLAPIALLVEDGLRRSASDERHLDSRPSELRIAQALGAVNVLFSQQQPEEVNGLYSVEATLNEAASAGGVEDTWEAKLELIDAWRLLDGTYLALVEERKTIAVKIFSLRKVEKRDAVGEDGKDRTFYKVFFDITKEAIENGSQSLLYADYNHYRQELKGAAGKRFLHQILCKNHINEEDLIDAVFANKTKVKEAALGLRKAKTKEPNPNRSPAEEAQLIRRTLQQNRPAQRKQLAAMFEKAVELGLVASYKRTKGKAGKGYVYSWYRETPAERLGLSEG